MTVHLRGIGPYRCRNLGHMSVARTEEVFLTQVTELSAEFLRQGRMIVDHQSDTGPTGDGQDRFCQAAHLSEGRLLGAQLNQVRPAVAKLLHHGCRVAPAQESGINKGIKPAFL